MFVLYRPSGRDDLSNVKRYVPKPLASTFISEIVTAADKSLVMLDTDRSPSPTLVTVKSYEFSSRPRLAVPGSIDPYVKSKPSSSIILATALFIFKRP